MKYSKSYQSGHNEPVLLASSGAKPNIAKPNIVKPKKQKNTPYGNKKEEFRRENFEESCMLAEMDCFEGGDRGACHFLETECGGGMPPRPNPVPKVDIVNVAALPWLSGAPNQSLTSACSSANNYCNNGNKQACEWRNKKCPKVDIVNVAALPWLSGAPNQSLTSACSSANNYCNNGNKQACEWRNKKCSKAARPSAATTGTATELPPWLSSGGQSINDACGSAHNYCNNGNMQACQWRDKECQGVDHVIQNAPWLNFSTISDACGSADNYCNNGNIQACHWRDKECQGVGRPMPWLPPGPHSINDACSAANNYCNNGNMQACKWRDKECQGVVYATGPGVGNAPSCQIEKNEIKNLKTELSATKDDVEHMHNELAEARAAPVAIREAEKEVKITAAQLVEPIIGHPELEFRAPGHRESYPKLAGGNTIFLTDPRDMPQLVAHTWGSIGWYFDSNRAQINEIARADVKQRANTVFGVKFSHVNISKTENPVFTMTNSNIRHFRRKFAKRLYYIYYSNVINEMGIIFTLCQNIASGQSQKASSAPDEIFKQLSDLCGADRDVPGEDGITSAYVREELPYHFTALEILSQSITTWGGVKPPVEFGSNLKAAVSGFQESMGNLKRNRRVVGEAIMQEEEYPETIEGRGDSTRYAFREDIVMPPDTDVETFTVKAKEVILTIVKDEKMPGWLHKTIPVHAREEIDGELGLSLKTAKWSEIFRAMEPTNPDGLFRGGGETRDMIIWQRRQIIIIVSYVLRHLKNNEEWIISTMEELMSGHYKSNEYVSLAVEFFTILGRSVGLNRSLGSSNDKDVIIKKYVDSLRNLKTSSDALIYDLRRTVTRMQQELEQGDATVAHYRAELEQGDATVTRTVARLAESEENESMLAQQIQSYIETIDGLEITVADLREQIKTLKSDKTTLTESLNSHGKTITELDATIESLKEQLEPLRSDNAKLTSDLKNKIEEHNKAVKAAAEAAVTATTECAAARDELIKNHEEAQKANEENVAELNESITGLDTTIDSLGEQIETLKSDKTTLTGKITDLEASLAENTCAVDIEDAEVAEIIDEAVEEITTLDSVTKKLTKQKKESETKLKKAEEDLAMRNKIIIGLAVFIFILIIVLLIK